MKIKYCETKTDREIGLDYFLEIKNLYGTPFLWLLLAISSGIVSIIEIIYKVHIIGTGYLGVLVSAAAIWLLGINRYLEIRKFKINEDIVYEFDFNKNIIVIKNKDYLIISYYDFIDSFLIEYEKGYVSLIKKKLDDDVLKKLNIKKDK